ncbi:MAG: pyridoxal-phosphate dependent enzyme [Micropruina sp.]|uniref:pyridoxal-phosphate dependent enzyme n=1 Tax=Micropruina sp. TaxID=2737536 RepID=UPI0039E5B2CB
MNSLLDLVGGSPVAWIDSDLPLPHPGFWAKLEAVSVGGMKARAAVAMLAGARRRGELQPGALVVESTSGSLGLGLSLAASAFGHPLTLVVDDELEWSMRGLLAAHGATLEVVTSPDPVGGWQEARLKRIRRLLRDNPGAYWPDQYNNPDNSRGYQSLADELIAQLPPADVLICSVGTGGHSAGILSGIRRHWPDVRLVGVDSLGSTIFGQPARPRLMRGLGSSIYPRNVAYDQFHEVHWVSPRDAVATCRLLAGAAQIAGGWSTGAAALVAAWQARVEPGARVVVVLPDGPHRYLGTIYDDDWCRARGLLGPATRTPVEICDPHHVEATTWSRCVRVSDPLKVAG